MGGELGAGLVQHQFAQQQAAQRQTAGARGQSHQQIDVAVVGAVSPAAVAIIAPIALGFARQYGITRSATRALLNVSVRRGEPGADVAVPAKVLAVATNLAGQRNGVAMREVRDGDALYYLGEAPVNGQDTLTFELEITVQGQAPMSAVFRQEFFPQ